jgi:hypothetical protein
MEPPLAEVLEWQTGNDDGLDYRGTSRWGVPGDGHEREQTRVWTLGHGVSEVEIFLAADQVFGPHGGGGCGCGIPLHGQAVAVSLSMGERRQSPTPRASGAVG